MNRYLFLDLDGVMNNAKYFARTAEERAAVLQRIPTPDERLRHQVDPEATVHLNAIVRASGAKVIISSSWRLVHSVGSIKRALHQRGFEYTKNIIGATGYSKVGDSTNRRGLEIQGWITEHNRDVCHVAILDDDSDMGTLMPFLVKTTWNDGLLAEHVALTLKLLGVE